MDISMKANRKDKVIVVQWPYINYVETHYLVVDINFGLLNGLAI